MWGGDRGGKREFCARHIRAGIVDNKGKKCLHDGSKRSSYGVARSRKTLYFVQHAKGGMINVRAKRHGIAGCSGRVAYLNEGLSVETLCRQHASEVTGAFSPAERAPPGDTLNSSLAENGGGSTTSVLGIKHCTRATGTHGSATVGCKSDSNGYPNGQRRGTTTPLIPGLSTGDADVVSGEEEAGIKL